MKNFMLLIGLLLLSLQASAAFPVNCAHTSPDIHQQTIRKNHRLVYPETQTGPFGTWSLVFGIASIALIWMGGGLFAIPAIILGLEGKKRHQKYANAGYILGQIGGLLTIVAAVVLLVIAILFFTGAFI